MCDSNSSGKKPIEEVQALRPRKPKLERLRPEAAERKKAEEELKQSREFIANVINALDDPVFVKDEEHRWAILNDAACEVTGRPREELIGKTDYDLFPKKQADVFWERDNHVLNNGGTDVNEEEITWHGKLHTISTKKSVFTDSLTGKKFIAGTIRDITERKRAEEALQKNQSLLNETGKMAKVGGWEFDVETLEQVWTEEVYRIHEVDSHFKPTVEAGISFYALESRPIIVNAVQKAIDNGEPFDVELQFITAKGNHRWVHAIGKAHQQGGKTIKVSGTFQDITNRKKAEEALHKEKDKAQKYLDIAGVMFVAINAGGEVTLINKKGCEVLGYEEEKIVGKNWFDNFLPKRVVDGIKPVSEKLLTGKLKAAEYFENPVLTKSGEERLIAWHNTILKDENGKVIGYLSSGQDITERKRAEAKLLDYQAQLKSLASQLTLAEEHERRRIATELHDQISQSLVVSKLKLEKVRESASSVELGNALNEVCNSLGQTIAETRSLTSEVHSPLLSLLGFEAAVADWLTEQIEGKYGIAVEFKDDGQPKPLDDDIRILLFRDVRELLTNIVKHAHAHKVKVSIRKVGSRIRVEVKDDGIGFNPSEVTWMPAITGGFGLFSIRERLEEVGGRLKIESKPGHGTTVAITAPLKAEKNAEGR